MNTKNYSNYLKEDRKEKQNPKMNKKKNNNKMGDQNPTISITVKVFSLSIPIKRQKLSG